MAIHRLRLTRFLPYVGSGLFNDNMINRDKRRFEMADGNKDGKLDYDEFVDFLHPEETESMRDIVVIETIEDIDKNGDGFIDIQEYIGICPTHSYTGVHRYMPYSFIYRNT